MKHKIVWVAVSAALLFAASAYSQPASGQGERKGHLQVTVDGCPNDHGVARIGLVNSLDGYKDSSKAFMSTKAPISKGKAVYDFKNVPYGEYAVTVYHDENGNNQLDKSMFGKPIEAYGFSNNARGVIGKPDYQKAAFTFNKAQMTVTVHVD